jgi:hypothetical protein
MIERKRASLVALKINASIKNCDIVLSKDEVDPIFETLAATNRIHRVGDEILWNHPLCAERAFSSPEAFKVILNLFEKVTR